VQFGSACDHRSWDGYQRGDDGLAAVELEHVAPGAAHSVLGCSTIFAASAIPGAPPVSVKLTQEQVLIVEYPPRWLDGTMYVDKAAW
jgi:hypothetical protein